MCLLGVLGLTGCVSTQVPVVIEPVALAAEGVCNQARTLERDLSDDGVYAGAQQVYLNEQGQSCRYH